MGEKKSFVLYYDFKEPLEELSDKDKGQVLMAMFEYCEYGTIPQLSKQAAIAFKFLKKFLDIDREKYEEKCNKRREAGAKGGAPKGNQNAKKNNQKQAKQAKVDLVELKQAKQADIRYTINDNDLLPNGNKKESKKESGSFDAILREYTEDEETLSLLGEWLKVRKAKRAAMTDYAIRLNIDKLNTMAQESHMGVKEYLKEVICRGWQAFYPINQFEKKGKPPNVDYSHVKGVINL